MAGKTYNPLTAQQQCNIICCKKTTQFEGQAPVRQFSVLRVKDLDPGNFLSAHLPGNTPSGCEILQPRVWEGGFMAQLLSNSWENLLCKSLTSKIVKVILVFTIVEAHKSISSSFDDVFLWKFVSPQRHPLFEKLKKEGTLHYLFQVNSISSAKHCGRCVTSKYGMHNYNCSANFILKFFPCFPHIPHAALVWICFGLWSDINDFGYIFSMVTSMEWHQILIFDHHILLLYRKGGSDLWYWKLDVQNIKWRLLAPQDWSIFSCP